MYFEHFLSYMLHLVSSIESEALEPRLAHTLAAGAYPGFCSTKQQGVFLLHLDGMLVYCSGDQKFRLYLENSQIIWELTNF